MGFARRVVRKSVRRATPRPVRQAMHPARAVKNAVTPRPVKQVSRATYTVRHPIGATENKLIGAALYPPGTGTGRRGGLSFWLGLWRRREQPELARAVPARWPYAEPSGGVKRPSVPQPAPSPRQAPAQQPRPRKVEPWPARQGFRTPAPARPLPQQPVKPPSSAGQWELDARRHTGLGDGSSKP
jgi:hypothetical protein